MVSFCQHLLALVAITAAVVHTVGAVPETITAPPGCSSSSVSTKLVITPTLSNDDQYNSLVNSVFDKREWKAPGEGERLVTIYAMATDLGGTMGVVTAHAIWGEPTVLSAGLVISTSSVTFTTPCKPTGQPAIPSGCEPHLDHWHCVPGVPEPTFPPGGADSCAAPPGCSAHIDHWHCEPNVPEPTFKPCESGHEHDDDHGHGNATAPTLKKPTATLSPSGAASSLEAQVPSWATFLLGVLGLIGAI